MEDISGVRETKSCYLILFAVKEFMTGVMSRDLKFQIADLREAAINPYNSTQTKIDRGVEFFWGGWKKGEKFER